MTKVCYPGSFDPLSNGHLDIIERICKQFDDVTILIANNKQKHYLFSASERKEMIEEVLKDYKNVKVVIFDGLVVKFCKENNINLLVRGLRNIQDYENEFNLYQFNKDLEESIETILLFPSSKTQMVSSSAIKELISFNADISKYVPAVLKDKIISKFK